MAGIESGAVLVQGTVNGIGERNGNANLTTIIPNLILKMERSLNCSENLKDLRALSLFVDEMSNQSSNSKAPLSASVLLLTRAVCTPTLRQK